ncbi:MAG: T9SS type A sorting domain-containing protein [Flavobacteriaceae bacterium]|nr:MAG: T9SS type A sorting domain-containing protein [Flavobacteriaceae bacterium]
MKKQILFIFIQLAVLTGYAQTTLYSESFEAAPSGTTYTVQPSFFNDLGQDYLIRATPATAAAWTTSTYTGQNGSNILAIEDVDGSGGPCDQEACLLTGDSSIPNPPARTDVEIAQITTASITISSHTLTSLKLLIGATGSSYELYNETTARPDYVQITYSVDGGAYQQLGLFTGNGSGQLSQDTNGDDIGDGTALGVALTEFTFDISGISGSTLQIKINISSNAGNEEIAIDNLRVEGNATTSTPTVASTAASNIYGTSAVLGGNVTADGGASVTTRGVVYAVTATNANPVIGGTGVTTDTNGSGTGTFSETISGLSLNTQYSFRAYATNSQGTSYGNALIFTTDAIDTNVFTGTTNSDWATAGNWSLNSVPTGSQNVVINNVTNDPVISTTTGATVNNLTVGAAGSLTVNSNASHRGSLIVNGTATGNIIYKRFIDDANWHLVAAPVTSQGINDFATNVNGTNAIRTNGSNEYAIGTYDNTLGVGNRWVYYSTTTAPGAGNFVSGQGYSFSRSAAGEFTFEGTMATSNVIAPLSTASGTHYWSCIGNPYPSYLPANNNANATTNVLGENMSALHAEHTALYIWNGSAYTTVNHISSAFQLAPGQAFVVRTRDASENFTFSESIQNHQSGLGLSSRTSNNTIIPAIEVHLSNGTLDKVTTLKYSENTTTGLDVGYDAGAFEAGSTGLSINTHLVSDNRGVDFMLQCLPDTDYETIVVPLSVKASENETLTFSTVADNLPEGIDVYLQDLANHTVQKINDDSYEVTLTDAISGAGRFYLHTAQSTLSIEKGLLEYVDLYKTANRTLRVTGLVHQGTASLKVYTISGRKVFVHHFDTRNLVHDVPLPDDLKRGIYFVQVISGNEKHTKKIIIE